MLVYIAVLMPVLLLFCGLVVDVGQLEVRRLQMQSASDAAALGAAQELERKGLPGSWASYGQSEAATNGFTNGSANTTVTVTQQPNYGAYAGFYDAVQTTITQQVPLSFLSLMGKQTSTVTAQSTALVATCAYLSGAANLTTNAFKSTSSSVTSYCPWYINSSANMDSGSTYSALAENVTGAAGASSWTVGSGSAPRYNVQTMPNPLSSIVQPTAGTCSATTSITASQTLTPGTYCNLTIRCSSACLISMQAGLYIFAGGLTAVNAAFYGTASTGFTLYFTKNGNSYGTFSCSTTDPGANNTSYCIILGYAPTDASNGGIPGVLMMNDRNWVHTNAQDFTFSNTSDAYSGIYGDGIVYLTGTGMSFSGATTTYGSYFYVLSRYLAMDVDNLVLNNTTVGMTSDFSTISGGSRFLPQGGLVQ